MSYTAIARHPSAVPTRGRPYDVLRYIDYVEDDKRSLPIDPLGGPAELFRALRESEAAFYAADARMSFAIDDVRSRQFIAAGLERQIELHA